MEELSNLVKLAKKNDKEAFCKLITYIKKDLYLIAKTKLKSEDDMADVIQDTIIVCYKNIKNLRNINAFKAWAIKILINKCNKLYGKQKNLNVSIEDNHMDNYLQSNYNIDENLSFQHIIKNLNKEEQLVLNLYYYCGYTTKEISKILKIKENTIKSKIHRAKMKLKSEYKEKKEENYG